MTPSPDVKQKTMKRLGEINAVLQEYGIKARFSVVGSDVFEFTCSRRPSNSLVKALYLREGVEQVNFQVCGRETMIVIQFSKF